MAQKHEGHRQRMLRKLTEGSLTEAELIEVMLYPLLPRKDTNGIAHRLLSRFGSIAETLNASKEELQTVDGVGPQLANNIRLTGAVYLQYAKNGYKKYDGSYHAAKYVEYAKDSYSNLPYEVMDLLLLNEGCEVYHQIRLTNYHEHEVSTPLKEIAQHLSTERPSGLVLAHNHPVSSAEPSEADDEATKKVQLLCSMQGVAFCDHLVFSPLGEPFSYYASGRMKQINRDYAIDSVVKEERRAETAYKENG